MSTVSNLGAKFQEIVSKVKPFLKKPWVWGIIVAILLAIYFSQPDVDKSGEAPAPISQAPNLPAPSAPMEGDPTYTNFTLTNQEDVPFGSKDLKNKAYIMNPFFVDSPAGGGTPAIHTMKKLQEKYDQAKSSVKIVSITVDATNDRPIDIKRFVDQFGLNLNRWTFLTGPAGYTRKVLESYGIRSGERRMGKAGLYDIEYDNKVLIVDGKGEIRGTYPFPTNEKAIDEIFEKSYRLR